MVALICLATGAVLDAATGACQGKGGGEQTLLRDILEHLDEGDILLGDWYHAGAALQASQSLGADAILDQLDRSGLRGRGGAGFPTGLKWSFLPENHPGPVYFCLNADESEPGTCSDRDILRFNPHAVVEGMAIGGQPLTAGPNMIFVPNMGPGWYSAVGAFKPRAGSFNDLPNEE